MLSRGICLQAQKRATPLPASRFLDFEGGSMRDVLADLGNLGLEDGDTVPHANGDVHHLPEVPDDMKLDDPIDENPSTAEHTGRQISLWGSGQKLSHRRSDNASQQNPPPHPPPPSFLLPMACST